MLSKFKPEQEPNTVIPKNDQVKPLSKKDRLIIQNYSKQYDQIKEGFLKACSAILLDNKANHGEVIFDLLNQLTNLDKTLDSTKISKKLVDSESFFLDVKISILTAKIYLVMKGIINLNEMYLGLAAGHAYNAIRQLQGIQTKFTLDKKDVLFQRDIEYAFDILKSHSHINTTFTYDRKTFHKLAYSISNECNEENSITLGLIYPCLMDQLHLPDSFEFQVTLADFRIRYQEAIVSFEKMKNEKKLEFHCIMKFSAANLYCSSFNLYAYFSKILNSRSPIQDDQFIEASIKKFSEKDFHDCLKVLITGRENQIEPAINILKQYDLSHFKQDIFQITLFLNLISKWDQCFFLQFKIHQQFLLSELSLPVFEKIANETFKLKNLALCIYQLYTNFTKALPHATGLMLSPISNIENEPWMINLEEHIQITKKEMATKVKMANIERDRLIKKQKIEDKKKALLENKKIIHSPVVIDETINKIESESDVEIEALLKEVVEQALAPVYIHEEQIHLDALDQLKRNADDVKKECIDSIKKMNMALMNRNKESEPFTLEMISDLNLAMQVCLAMQTKLLAIYSEYIQKSNLPVMQSCQDARKGIEINQYNIEKMIEAVRNKINQVKQSYLGLCEKIKRDRDNHLYKLGLTYINENKLNKINYTDDEIITFGKDIFIQKGMAHKKNNHSPNRYSEEKRCLAIMKDFILGSELKLGAVPVPTRSPFLKNSVFKFEPVETNANTTNVITLKKTN